MTGYVGLGRDMVMLKKPPLLLRQRRSRYMALRAACTLAGYQAKDNTHTHLPSYFGSRNTIRFHWPLEKLLLLGPSSTSDSESTGRLGVCWRTPVAAVGGAYTASFPQTDFVLGNLRRGSLSGEEFSTEL